ncbi:hypothetical protein [Vibrio parahaemolyticus]|uniref:hypothetical protein n=1 Tax=Vibrio parahaemolyticus TaxID=670 RepID=UPI0028081B0B|nr:hypothetical protein [Vibrio parahaemolyticus]
MANQKMISVHKWGEQNLDPVPSRQSLNRYARTGQLGALAKKIGNYWYVPEDAVFVGMSGIGIDETDETLTRIFANG